MSQISSMKNLGDSFRQYFEIVPAATDALRNDVYSIRHEVYCEQLQYESTNLNGQEKDEYDEQSVHCLMRTLHEPKHLVGCTRLIRTLPEDRYALLPLELSCEKVIDRSIIDPSKLPRESIAEVSRLAIRGEFRRRKGEQQLPGSIDFGDAGHPRFPFIPVGLYLGTVAMSKLNGIDMVFLLIEPRLLDHFAKIGFKIRPIGEPIEHRGLRVPSFIDVNDLVLHMRSLLKSLYREIYSEVEHFLEEQSHPRPVSSPVELALVTQI